MTEESNPIGPLTKKVGGQPAWVWIIGVVVLVLGAQWYRSRSAAVKAAAAVSNPSQSAVDSLIGNGSGLPASPGAPTSQPPPLVSTAQWMQAALSAVKNAGHDQLSAAHALTNFLQGGQLTYSDTQIVNAALDAVGAPPGFTGIAPGAWQDRTIPTPTNPHVIGFIRPAGFAGIFAQYDTGDVVYLKSGIEAGKVMAAAAAQGVSTQVVDIPTNDPRWQNADVVKNQNLGTQYLWGEFWSNYVQPQNYEGRVQDSIVANQPDTVKAAQQAWQRSLSVIPATYSAAAAGDNSAYQFDQKAYYAAFPTTTNPDTTGQTDATGHVVSGTAGL